MASGILGVHPEELPAGALALSEFLSRSAGTAGPLQTFRKQNKESYRPATLLPAFL